jgi:hypothetical protein
MKSIMSRVNRLEAAQHGTTRFLAYDPNFKGTTDEFMAAQGVVRSPGERVLIVNTGVPRKYPSDITPDKTPQTPC